MTNDVVPLLSSPGSWNFARIHWLKIISITPLLYPASCKDFCKCKENERKNKRIGIFSSYLNTHKCPLHIIQTKTDWANWSRFPSYFPSPRWIKTRPSEKTINKSNICKNNSFIYINISFILTNISFIYTFQRGVSKSLVRWNRF